jgi:hypothetical protein
MVTDGKYKQVFSECSQQVSGTNEDSEDEGLKIGDLITPGSDQLIFGSFDTMEIKMLTSINVDESAQVVINEYGSNLKKYKLDPLTTIEAKNSICESSRPKFFRLEDYMIDSGPSKYLPTIEEEKEEPAMKERAISVSPIKGSQGGHEVDISSQEDCTQKENQDVDWELKQEEDGQNSYDIDMKLYKDREVVKETASMEKDKEDLATNTICPVRLGSVINDEEEYNRDGDHEAWETQATKMNSSAEIQEKGQDGWPTWKEVRQSKRLRDNGTS